MLREWVATAGGSANATAKTVTFADELPDEPAKEWLLACIEEHQYRLVPKEMTACRPKKNKRR